ncbi:MAG: molybdopterin molybdenumtransferase MoeA [Gammaproteobacteria bacterium]|nr:MAG: molybdopterin molybdenumtransferase MoeA [Gammaproteobacteria bacterium]
MDYCSQPGLLPIADAISQMQSAITAITDSETVPLQAALDRVNAEAVYSSVNIPSHDNSAMDGYAFSTANTTPEQPLKLAGIALAGHPFNGEVQEGECVRIMTGAIVPANTDTVIMQEQVFVTENFVQLKRLPDVGENIRRAGEDIALNSLVLEKGKRIAPLYIGLLASLGVTHVKVFRRLRIAVLSTGDELKAGGQPLQAGEIYDSNRQTLLALLSRINVTAIDCGLVEDDPQKIRSVFESAIAQADVIISSGGVSVGDADYTKDVLQSLGKINFWKVAIKPGKPFAFGSFNKPQDKTCWFFGLPGNPVSAVVTYHQLVLPALRYLAGEEIELALGLRASTESNLKKQPGRADYQRGILREINGENIVQSTGNQGSGVLTSIANANCYIVLEQESGSVTKGEQVRVIPFDKFLL